MDYDNLTKKQLVDALEKVNEDRNQLRDAYDARGKRMAKMEARLDIVDADLHAMGKTHDEGWERYNTTFKELQSLRDTVGHIHTAAMLALDFADKGRDVQPLIHYIREESE